MLMREWAFPIFAAVLCWGIWAFLPKLSGQLIDSKSALVYQGLGILFIVLVVFLRLGDQIETHPKSVILDIAAGILNGLGILFYIKAASKGSISVVSTLSALYPLVTITLAVVFLQEELTFKQIVGIGFALFSIILVTI